MAKTKTPKVQEQSLESIMWNCRVIFRGKVSGENNRDAVMGLVFLKFAGDKFEKRRAELVQEYGDVSAFLEKDSFYRAKNVFYLNKTSRWSFIVKNASADNITVILDKAMADIEDKNPPLKGALPQNFYSTLGLRSGDIKGLIDEINKIDERRFQEKDLIGRVYEYFLQVFAIDLGQGTGKENGEFYTPASIVELIAELIEPYNGQVYDPCCGSGGMFVQSINFVERHHGNRAKISILGQESKPDTWRLAKMNLAIRGISCNFGDKNASTFTQDQHSGIKVQYIMANPPFNLKNWRGNDELTDDYRWKGYSVPPVANANYAWVLHMLSKLDVTNGIAGFLLANGALNAGGDEYKIRKHLIENDKIEAIIVLPREMFYSTDISVTLWVINNNKKVRTLNGRNLRDRRNEVLFVDLRQWNKNIYEKKFVMFDEKQIAEIKQIYTDWQIGTVYKDVPELCKSAKLEDIKVKDYSLAPSKYIKFIDHDLRINYKSEMKRIQTEMRDVLKAEKQSQVMLEKAFRGIGYGIE